MSRGISGGVLGLAVASILLCGAIFGFFYAWVCSTIWGLDQADPRVAIAAMQAMNASVRNIVFFPAFFLTPLVTAGAALAIWRAGGGRAALWFGAAAAVYLLFGLILTLAVNVPMNEALAALAVPEDPEEARAIWSAYSARWSFWNQVRTGASGLALALAAWGAIRLGARTQEAALAARPAL